MALKDRKKLTVADVVFCWTRRPGKATTMKIIKGREGKGEFTFKPFGALGPDDQPLKEGEQ